MTVSTIEDLARGLADRVDQIFTLPFLGGSVQRKAAIEVLIRDAIIRQQVPDARHIRAWIERDAFLG